MDQKKTGAFLKELRKKKCLTQEQLAEKFNVSSRTISRWENGCNMPDLDVLIELSDYYEVGLRELLTGERKNENMEQNTKHSEMEEIALDAADYTNTEIQRYIKRVRLLLLTGVSFWFVSSLISHTPLTDCAAFRAVSDFADGAAFGMAVCGIILTSRYYQKIKAFKQRLLKRR